MSSNDSRSPGRPSATDSDSPPVRLQDVEQRVSVLESRFDALMSTVDRLEQAVLGETERTGDYDIQPLVEQLDEIEGDLEDTRALVEVAESTPEMQTKKALAKRLSRNQLLVDALVDSKQGAGSVTARQVADMAKPDRSLDYRTVHDAWDVLVEDWDCFTVRSASESPSGKKQLVAKGEDVPAVLVRGVANDLSDDEMAERLISTLDGGRGS